MKFWISSLRFVLLASVGAALVEGLAGSASAQAVTYFRGDQGLAANDAAPLPEEFDATKNLVWRTPLGPGHSSPNVHGDRIFLSTFEDQKLATVALDRKSGKVLWTRPITPKELEKYHPTGSPASSTPACDGQRVFSFFGSYGLLCYDLEGKLLWERPMGPFQDEFGSSSSPVLVDGKLLLNEDHDVDSFLLCLDAATGKTLWQTRRDGFTRSYSTPIVWTVGGKKLVVVAGALQLVAYDLENGQQMWSVDGLARIVNTTPVLHNNTLFVATWSPGGDTDARIGMEPWGTAVKLWDKNKDGKLVRDEVDNKDVLDRFYRIDLNQDLGLDETEWAKYARVFELARNSLLAIRAGESATSSPSIAWQFDRGLPYVPSPLVYRGVLYMVKDGGIVTSLDPATGKQLKQARAGGAGNYYASPVAGDGKVFVISDKGTLSVLKADGAWSILNSHDFNERAVATPVIVDGQIIVRTEKAVYCFRR